MDDQKPNYMRSFACNNCGMTNVLSFDFGTPIVLSKVKNVCANCGCDEGWTPLAVQ